MSKVSTVESMIGIVDPEQIVEIWWQEFAPGFEGKGHGALLLKEYAMTAMSYETWRDMVDPDGIYSEEEFWKLSVTEKVKIQILVCGYMP
jgi:ribosomal protein S18 acetylase RimI-like enzyme